MSSQLQICNSCLVQIGLGELQCTFNSGITYFAANGERIEVGGGVTQIKHGTTATLKVILTSANSFQDRGVYYTNSSGPTHQVVFSFTSSSLTLVSSS